MSQVSKIRALAATAAVMAVFAAPLAARAETVAQPTVGTPLEEPASGFVPPAPVEQGTALAPPTSASPTPPSTPPASGGVSAGSGEASEGGGEEAAAAPADSEGALPAPNPAAALAIPSLPTSTCAATGVPPTLIPIYQQAAAAYGLGPQGPAVLAGINQIETGFGSNLGPSYAGAVGWMQFMPETWDAYGVDANEDGVADPNNPEDAIYAAASYLSASGMPADTYG